MCTDQHMHYLAVTVSYSGGPGSNHLSESEDRFLQHVTATAYYIYSNDRPSQESNLRNYREESPLISHSVSHRTSKSLRNWWCSTVSAQYGHWSLIGTRWTQINFNIIFPSKAKLLQWLLPFKNSIWHFMFISSISHVHHIDVQPADIYKSALRYQKTQFCTLKSVSPTQHHTCVITYVFTCLRNLDITLRCIVSHLISYGLWEDFSGNRKIAKSFVMSVSPSVCPHETTLLLLDGFGEIWYQAFFENLSRK